MYDQSISEAVSNSLPSKKLSIDFRSIGILTISTDYLAHMWKKAEELLSNGNAAVICPGEATVYLVASSSTPRNPHRVTFHTGGRHVCTCIGYNSAKICAHALVVAELRNSLFDFVAWYKRSKHAPSAGKLSDLAKPTSTGKKGNTGAGKKRKASNIGTGIQHPAASDVYLADIFFFCISQQPDQEMLWVLSIFQPYL